MDAALQERRERVFLVLAGFFLCSMTMLNIIGITRFIQLGPLALAVGVLPYPLTFLCTDLISELYGKSRANFLVTVGLALNLFILAVMWLGNAMPSVPAEAMPPWQVLQLAEDVALPNGSVVSNQVQLFDLEEDPEELVDIAGRAEAAGLRSEMEARLIDQLSGEDREWVLAGRLVGLPFEPSVRNGNKGLSTQRGIHWPL